MQLVGYDMYFELDGKPVAAETDSSLSISAIIKESLYKSDKGNKRREVTGHDATFSINAAGWINEDDSVTEIDSDGLIDMAMKVGKNAEIPFVYNRGKATPYKGKMVISGYTESPNADSNVTVSLNCSLTGPLTKVSE